MKLVFDLTRTQPLGKTKVHGGGKYGVTVFLRLVQLYPNQIVAYYNDRSYIDPIVLETINEHGIKCYRQSEMPIVDAIRNEGGWVYAPLSKLSYIHEKDIHVICTVHGIRALEMPADRYEAYYEKNPLIYRVKQCVKRGLGKGIEAELKQLQKRLSAPNMHFVTVSNHSKYALLSFLPNLEKEKIEVFYSPSSIRKSEKPADTNVEYSVPNKYWLIVSGNRWYKNAIRGIMAFDQLFTERPEIQGNVIITGVKQLSEFKVKVMNPHRFQCVGFVDELTLKSFYRRAYALLYPSLNEGFGYPPLEAMYEGCPVMASAVASIPEVCGDAVLYFNPYLISEMKMRILQMEDAEIRARYVEKGREREKWIADKQEKDLSALCNYIISYVQ